MGIVRNVGLMNLLFNILLVHYAFVKFYFGLKSTW
jgi:hypothetical protein